MDPLAFQLSKLRWQLFVTLTFGANWNAKKTRNKVERVFSWLRFIADHHGIKLGEMLFVVSEELGEAGDRYHVHLLIGGLPKQPSVADCFAMQWLWAEHFKGGHAKIRPYAPTLCGVGYVLKSLSLSQLRAVSSEDGRAKAQALAGSHVGVSTTYAGANAYEVGKMGRADGDGLLVMLSRGCQRSLAGVATPRGKRRARSLAFFRRGARDTAADTVEKTRTAPAKGS